MQTFAVAIKASSSITKIEIQSVAEFDDSEIYSAFAGVSELDEYLAMNNGKSYSEVSQNNSALLNGVSSTTTLPLSASPDNLALGIPSFLWGCVFGWVGLVIVYLVTENKEQTKKALWGCIASTVVTVGLYIVLFAATAESGNPYYY